MKGMLIKVKKEMRYDKHLTFVMMKPEKNTITLFLIGSSLFLLTMLQVFWLSSSYKNEIFDLRREANSIFKNTVSQLRDSVFFRSLQPSADSAIQLLKSEGLHLRQMQEVTDTVYINKNSQAIQVFISASGKSDSFMNAALKPLTQKIQSLQKGSQQSFSIRIAADSLNLDTLRLRFQKNLIEANIIVTACVSEIKFTRRHLKSLPTLARSFSMEPSEYYIPPPIYSSLLSDTLRAEPVRLNPSKLYSASLTGVRSVVLKKITPQILFSIFLTGVTLLAFIFIYRTLREQQRLTQLKNDFISNMTHELKTPIATISVAIEALQNFRGLENPKLTQEYLIIAQNELSRLSLLTDKILKTSVFDSKGLDFQPEVVDLEKIAYQTVQSLKLVFEKANARVDIAKDGNNFTLHGGGIHLTNLVYNLLDNGLKYSTQNPVIKILLKENSESIILSVHDNGIGIPSQYKKKIFEKFFRVPMGDVHTIKGYGLGLSYVDSVVKAHGGSIQVDSELEKGSRFTITFPKKNG